MLIVQDYFGINVLVLVKRGGQSRGQKSRFFFSIVDVRKLVPSGSSGTIFPYYILVLGIGGDQSRDQTVVSPRTFGVREIRAVVCALQGIFWYKKTGFGAGGDGSRATPVVFPFPSCEDIRDFGLVKDSLGINILVLMELPAGAQLKPPTSY